MASEHELEAARLILNHRWAALATVEGGAPLATMVAYAPEPTLDGIIIFLSELSQHTRNLLRDPRVSLVISEPDDGEDDPQLLPRVSLTGGARPIAAEDAGFERVKALYLSRFPDAEMRFEMSDFHLFRLVPADIRYVGGFARAFSMSPKDLTDAAAALAVSS